MDKKPAGNAPKIGVLNEKPLHASLKKWYAKPGDQFEVQVNGFVIDIVRDDLLLEIQTGHFHPLKSKFETLLPSYRIRLIYPIDIEKWIEKQAETGKTVRIRICDWQQSDEQDCLERDPTKRAFARHLYLRFDLHRRDRHRWPNAD